MSLTRSICGAVAIALTAFASTSEAASKQEAELAEACLTQKKLKSCSRYLETFDRGASTNQIIDFILSEARVGSKHYKTALARRWDRDHSTGTLQIGKEPEIRVSDPAIRFEYLASNAHNRSLYGRQHGIHIDTGLILEWAKVSRVELRTQPVGRQFKVEASITTTSGAVFDGFIQQPEVASVHCVGKTAAGAFDVRLDGGHVEESVVTVTLDNKPTHSSSSPGGVKVKAGDKAEVRISKPAISFKRHTPGYYKKSDYGWQQRIHVTPGHLLEWKRIARVEFRPVTVERNQKVEATVETTSGENLVGFIEGPESAYVHLIGSSHVGSFDVRLDGGSVVTMTLDNERTAPSFFHSEAIVSVGDTPEVGISKPAIKLKFCTFGVYRVADYGLRRGISFDSGELLDWKAIAEVEFRALVVDKVHRAEARVTTTSGKTLTGLIEEPEKGACVHLFGTTHLGFFDVRLDAAGSMEASVVTVTLGKEPD